MASASPAPTTAKRRRTPRGLTFEDAGHLYRWNGQQVLSVTQVLHLEGLSTVDQIPGEIRAWALERGRLVHEACALYDVGRLDWSSLDPGLEPYVRAWERFATVSDFIAVEVEQRVVGPRKDGPGWMPRWAGTLDARGAMRGYPRILIDRKCGWGVPPAARLQLSAYGLTLDEPHVRAVVQLRPDGVPKLHLYEDNVVLDERRWLAALSMVELKLAWGLLTLEDAAPPLEEGGDECLSD